MLNPNLSNTDILFSEDFFPKEITQKYDDYLFHLNSPLKTIKAVLYESMQSYSIPGHAVDVLASESMPNAVAPDADKFGNPPTTFDLYKRGTNNNNKLLDGTTFILTFRNNILNWMYCLEILRGYHQRKSKLNEFNINLILKDSAEIKLLVLKLSKCFVTNLPGMTFSYNAGFNDSTTFDLTFVFNKFEPTLTIPEFNKTNLKL